MFYPNPSRLLLLFLVCGLTASTGLGRAQDFIAPPEPLPVRSRALTGAELAQRIRSSQPAEPGRFEGNIKIRPRRSPIIQIPIIFELILVNDTWKSIYETAPSSHGPGERITIFHQPGQANRYFLATQPAVGQPWTADLPLTEKDLHRPLAGSDFWLLDLGMDFLHWPGQRLIKNQMRKGRWCHVLESTRPPGAGQEYARVISWLDRETGGPLLAEAYDAKNKRIKEFAIGGFKKVEGEWQLEEMKIDNVKTRSRTWIEFEFD